MSEHWHAEALPGAGVEVLGRLVEESVLSGFYFASGTGLALHLGHRLSRDLDFFSPELFDEEALLHRLQSLPELAVRSRSSYTLHCDIQGVKVSFLGYPYPLLYPLADLRGAKVADPRDIACMKISAIASRGTRRDFVDLYFMAQQQDLAELLHLFRRKYEQTNYSLPHILKSLTYFEDAEKDPMPDMRIPADWPTIRNYFLNEVPRLL